jgi:hypothetical protein
VQSLHYREVTIAFRGWITERKVGLMEAVLEGREEGPNRLQQREERGLKQDALERGKRDYGGCTEERQ